MGVFGRLSRFILPIAMGLTILGPTASASALAGPFAPSSGAAPAIGQWQDSIARLPAPAGGCYQASYPALAWRATPCAVAPQWPLAPGPAVGPSTLGGPLTVGGSLGGPLTVGNGNDYSAQVSGTISSATGSFTHVSSGITERGQIDDQGSQVANEFTLQLNSQFFSGSPTCAKSSDPANCQAWEQFVYETDANEVFIQYWLINYDASCPSGWFSFSSDCYTNSPATSFTAGPLTAAGLSKVKFVGAAKTGGNDEVSISDGGAASIVSTSDSKIDLANAWNTTEFGVFGDGGGGAANFGNNSTLDAQTTLVGTSRAAPKCVQQGFTGETNNLTLSGTAALGSESSPTIASAQTNATTTTASCATAAGASPAITSVAPKSGPPGGAQTVTITGTNFTGASAVKFATSAATSVVVVSSTKITAKTPAHGAGVVDVRIVTPAGTSAVVAADKYTFT
jgi:hypothetical protein